MDSETAFKFVSAWVAVAARPPAAGARNTNPASIELSHRDQAKKK
jgi:hypothetical protein